MGKLTKLKWFNLAVNQIATLPSSFGNLKNLEWLSLSKNQLKTLPKTIGDLKNLEEFYLCENLLTALPDNIGKLTKLIRLSLYQNKLTTLPDAIGKLTNLAKLDLHQNQLRILPDNIGKLKKLMSLSLHQNQMTSLPDAIGKLMNLTRLDLHQNQLKALPDEIGKLEKLITLDLHQNNLTTLPDAISKLKNLKCLLLDYNPLISPLQGIVKRGTIAIINHLRELEKKSKKRYEAKLLILGDGGEGKTCVSRALRGLKFKQQVSTKGVEVVPWTFSHPDYPKEKNKEIKLNIWDFEGQEIHHQTHQFFLTEGALYILVFKCREIFRMDRAEYWLDTIRARAPKSQVVLVITGCEERTPYLPLDKLKNNYVDLLQGENWFFFRWL